MGFIGNSAFAYNIIEKLRDIHVCSAVLLFCYIIIVCMFICSWAERLNAFSNKLVKHIKYYKTFKIPLKKYASSTTVLPEKYQIWAYPSGSSGIPPHSFVMYKGSPYRVLLAWFSYIQ